MFDLWEIIKNMLNSMLGEIINSWLHELESTFGNLLQTAFYLEKMPRLTANLFTPYTVSSAIGVLYLTTIGLLTLKLCWKGWKVYVLGRDGEAEVSPTSILLNSLYALGVAIAFPFLYDIVVNIVVAICDRVLLKFPGANSDNYIGTIIGICSPLTNTSITVFLVILILIFVIVCVILAIQMIFRGVEMLIYRMGVPLAVVGLVDSDGGVWKNYIHLFFQQLATIMIQYICICFALRLAASVSVPTMILAIVFLIAGFKMPKILRPVLSSGGGGGGGAHVVYTAMMVAKSFGGA